MTRTFKPLPEPEPTPEPEPEPAPKPLTPQKGAIIGYYPDLKADSNGNPVAQPHVWRGLPDGLVPRDAMWYHTKEEREALPQLFGRKHEQLRLTKRSPYKEEQQ